MRHRNLFACLQQTKIAMKKMKKIVCGEVCALGFACVEVQREMVDGHRVCGSQVTKFVGQVNSPPARGGVHYQEKIAKPAVDEGNRGHTGRFLLATK